MYRGTNGVVGTGAEYSAKFIVMLWFKSISLALALAHITTRYLPFCLITFRFTPAILAIHFFVVSNISCLWSCVYSSNVLGVYSNGNSLTASLCSSSVGSSLGFDYAGFWNAIIALWSSYCAFTGFVLGLVSAPPFILLIVYILSPLIIPISISVNLVFIGFALAVM